MAQKADLALNRSVSESQHGGSFFSTDLLQASHAPLASEIPGRLQNRNQSDGAPPGLGPRPRTSPDKDACLGFETW